MSSFHILADSAGSESKPSVPPTDPLDTLRAPVAPFDPFPADSRGWTKAMRETIILAASVKDGLTSYQRAIQTDKHPDLTDAFKDREIASVNTVKDKLLIVSGALTTMVDLLGSRTDEQKENLCSFFAIVIDCPQTLMPKHIVMRCEADRAYVRKARAYLVSSHVFYKVNFALCPVTASKAD